MANKARRGRPNALTGGRRCLFVDQVGRIEYASTLQELQSKVGGGRSRTSKMYRDVPGGGVEWIGYVIGDYWFKCYAPVAVPANEEARRGERAISLDAAIASMRAAAG